MKLHPVKDGLIPEPGERGMTVRDKGGNKLIDVVDPKTGFCRGVTSPLLSSGKSVIDHKSPSGGTPNKGQDVRYDSESARYYDLIRDDPNGPVGLVIRTEADGDELLPCTRVRVIKIEGGDSSSSSAPVRKKKSARKENDEAAAAIWRAAGWTGPITREMRIKALEMIQIEKDLVSKFGS